MPTWNQIPFARIGMRVHGSVDELRLKNAYKSAIHKMPSPMKIMRVCNTTHTQNIRNLTAKKYQQLKGILLLKRKSKPN